MNVENIEANKYTKNGGFNMLKKIRKQLKNEKGLTLVELLAVIVILGIIVAIAIPAIGGIIDSSRVKAAKADAANIYNAANIYFTENSGDTTVNQGTEEFKAYIEDLGTVETFTVDREAKTITTTGKSGSKSYTISTTTLKGLKTESGKVEGPFAWTD